MYVCHNVLEESPVMLKICQIFTVKRPVQYKVWLKNYEVDLPVELLMRLTKKKC